MTISNQYDPILDQQAPRTEAELGHWLVLDPRGQVSFSSPSLTALMGCPASLLVGRHITELLSPDSQPLPVLTTLAVGQTLNLSLRLPATRNRLLTLDVGCQNLSSKHGLNCGWLLATRDTHHQHTLRLASELATLQERFAQLVLHNRTGLLVVGADGRIRFANPAAGAALGRDAALLNNEQFGIPSVTSATELDIVRASGELGVAEVTASHSEWHGEPAWLVMIHDISERKRAEEALRYHAEHDALSGLANRALLLAGLTRMLANARRQGSSLALLFMDLNRFKTINDSLGHSIGDLVLIEAAQRLRGCTRAGDLVARLGGDEFCVALDTPHGQDDALAVAEKIRRALAEPYMIDEHRLHAEASIGIACFPGDGDSTEILLRNADAAMYAAKHRGDGKPARYLPRLTTRNATLLKLETDLRQALARDQMRLRYQPKVHLADLSLSGCEALLRWCPTAGRLRWPGHFVPVLENLGLIVEVGDWVLAQACQQLAAWQAAGVQIPAVAVNLSPLQLDDEQLPSRVMDLLDQYALAPTRLLLEVTETAVMRSPDRARRILQALHQLGVGLHLDDFGTGHSSLSMLDRFPFDTLKIDRSFIRQLTTLPRQRQLVEAILSIATALGMRSVAEGVETPEQLDILRELGCQEAQGFLFGKPLTPGNLARLAASPSLAWLLARR